MPGRSAKGRSVRAPADIVGGDIELPKLRDVLLNAAVTSVGRRIARRDNRMTSSAPAVIDLSARSRFRIGNAPGTISACLSRALNKDGWRTDTSEILVPKTRHRLSVTLAANL